MIKTSIMKFAVIIDRIGNIVLVKIIDVCFLYLLFFVSFWFSFSSKIAVNSINGFPHVKRRIGAASRK